MDVFKTQFESVKKQFDALSASQKMLVAALVAVMALTLVYWSNYAGSAEMVSLMGGQALTEAEIANIDNVLATRDIKHTLAAGKVMVPTDQKTAALSALMFNHALPSNTRSAFEEMSKSLTAFSTETERQAVYTQALNKQMAVVIAEFPGVASATVVISAKSEQRIEGSVPPTAMVSIVTKPGSEIPPKKLARAAADGLAGAVSELTAGHVSVIVDGTPLRFPDSEPGTAGSDDDDKRKSFETEKESLVLHTLYPYINGLTVVVNCDVDNKKEIVDKKEFDKSKSFSQETQTINDSQETNNTPVKVGEPGAATNTGANVGVSLAGGGGGSEPAMQSNTTSSQESVTSVAVLPSVDTHTEKAAGKPSALSAAVGVPLSFFKAQYRGRHPTAKEPTETELDELIKTEINGIRDKVAKAIGIKAPTDLAVDMYVDMPPEVPPSAGAAAPSAAMSLLTAHGKEMAVGFLAVVSLMLMVMMVRKSSTVTTVMTSAGPMSIATLEEGRATASVTGPSPNMVATAGAGALDAMELGDDDVRTAQMLDQVSTMVKENPDGAAALVKKWLTRV